MRNVDVLREPEDDSFERLRLETLVFFNRNFLFIVLLEPQDDSFERLRLETLVFFNRNFLFIVLREPQDDSFERLRLETLVFFNRNFLFIVLREPQDDRVGCTYGTSISYGLVFLLTVCSFGAFVVAGCSFTSQEYSVTTLEYSST